MDKKSNEANNEAHELTRGLRQGSVLGTHEREVRWTENGQGRFAFVNGLCSCAAVYHRRFSVSRINCEDLGYITRTALGASDGGSAPRCHSLCDDDREKSGHTWSPRRSKWTFANLRAHRADLGQQRTLLHSPDGESFASPCHRFCCPSTIVLSAFLSAPSEGSVGRQVAGSK